MTHPTSWKLWRDGSHSPADNMAIDDILLNSMREQDASAVLRLYSWSEPAYTIGYFQPYHSAPPGDHVVVRRPSGGGVVNHHNDITFTLVFPATDSLFQCDRFESYRQINDAVKTAFANLAVDCFLFGGDIPGEQDRAFLVCFEQPAKFDVVTSHGKLCGGAQRRKLFGMLHQGSILRDQLSHLSSDQIVDSLVSAFQSAFDISFDDYIPTDDFLSEARDLATSRYSLESWNHKK